MRSFFLFYFLVLIGGLTAQPSLSTYSSIGIGDLRGLQLTNHSGKGGIGISYGNPWYLNNLNPALLPGNSITVYEAGIIAESKRVRQNDISDRNGAANLNYLALAFGIKPNRWTMSLGFMPYSTVNYGFFRQESIPGTTATVIINEEGSGGINQFFMAHGVKLHDRISIGVKASYLFGSIIKESTSTISDTLSLGLFSPAFFNRISYQDIQLSGGIAFNQPLGENLSLNLGMTIDNQTNVKAKEFERIDLRDANDVVIRVDTVSNNIKRASRIPRKLGFGISLNNQLKWNAGIDFTMQDWQEYQSVNGDNDGMAEAYAFRIGGEFTPNINNLDNYLARITYRLGFSYERTPYVFNGKKIDEIGINFGWSLPVSRINSLNFGLQFGKRGDTSDNLVRENFTRLLLGITFNDRWFVRRKFD